MSTAKKNSPSTREMERINWIEFREWVPAKIRTVLLPLGTLEPHGVAPNGTDILAPVAMARETGTRMLVVNWWSYCSDVTLEVFGEDGGHGAENETAYIMAIDPALVQKEHYKSEMATAIPPPNTWSAYPFPSTIMLYKEGQGYPKFDPVKAKTYFNKVNGKIARLIQETIKKWDMAGV